MKILLLGEYSRVHTTLAAGLKCRGHQVTVCSNGDFWKNYPRDIDVSRTNGRWGGIQLLGRIARIFPQLCGYDIVQLINPLFFELRAERLFLLYKLLRRYNKRIVLGGFGMDYYWVHENITRMPLRYSDFNIGSKLRNDKEAIRYTQDWCGTAKEKLNRLIADDCDAIVTGLYEYWVCYQPVFPQKTSFIPYPIQPTMKPSDIPPHQGKLRLFLGINGNRSAYKGTDIMLKAATDIVARYPERVALKVAKSLAFNEYMQAMEGEEAILDQLYSYTPSMNPLEAMAKGIICIGGGEPESYEILQEKELHPIINVAPFYESVYNELEQLVIHPERITPLRRQSIQYIMRHHDYLKVSAQNEQLNLSLLNTR